jgi:hypothetical protein
VSPTLPVLADLEFIRMCTDGCIGFHNHHHCKGQYVELLGNLVKLTADKTS